MRRPYPALLSMLLLSAAASLAIWLRLRDRADPPALEPTPPVVAEPPPLSRPGDLRDREDRYRACWREHEEGGGRVDLVFTVAVDPDADRPLARVARARRRAEDDTTRAHASPFEACVERATADLELLPPGGRDRLDIAVSLDLGG